MADEQAIGTPNEDAVKTLPNEVKLWQERVSIAKRELDDWAQSSGASRFIDEHNGKFDIFFNGLKGQIPVPPINEIFAYVDADVSNTYNRDPFMSVNPTAGTIKGSKLLEVTLNYWWRKLRVKAEVEPEIVDKDLTGCAWHKVGWQVESSGAEQDLKIIQEGLYSGRVDWKDLVWNFGAKNPPYDCLWMAQRIVKPLKYVKKKYPNAADLKGMKNPEINEVAYVSASFKDDIEVAVLWEIWDSETKQVFLIAEGLDKMYLDNPRPWPEYMSEFPFLGYWDFFSPGKNRPMSIVSTFEAQVLEKMVVMAAFVNHVKRWSRQALIRKGAISPADLDKIERGDDGAIIDYTGTGDLDKNLKMLDWGSVPPDFMILMDRLSAIQRDVNGQPEFERGGVTKTSTRTEGELQMIAQGAKGRTDRKLDRFETHLENIARHMLMHLKANFDFEQEVRISGDTPQDVLASIQDHIDPINKTIKFTPQDIDGEYDVEIKAGSTLPLNKENKVQIIQMILKILASVQGSASPLMQTLITELLDAYQIKSLEEGYQAEQQAQAQQAQIAQQNADSVSAKSKSQALKNVAQADKLGAQADTIHEMNIAVGPQQPQVPAGPVA